jgi:hypothetical protein
MTKLSHSEKSGFFIYSCVPCEIIMGQDLVDVKKYSCILLIMK